MLNSKFYYVKMFDFLTLSDYFSFIVAFASTQFWIVKYSAISLKTTKNIYKKKVTPPPKLLNERNVYFSVVTQINFTLCFKIFLWRFFAGILGIIKRRLVGKNYIVSENSWNLGRITLSKLIRPNWYVLRFLWKFRRNIA